MASAADKSMGIYVAGHKGMVGAAIVRALVSRGYDNIITRTHGELDLCDQMAVRAFFQSKKIDYVILAAAKVGGIFANSSLPAQFIYENVMIAANVIHEAFQTGVHRLLFLGSSCIYPKMAPQPLKEEYLLTGPLEPTNEPYAVAKITGIKLCEYYNRQYNTDFFAVMPTNLYGPNDNYDLEQSHVLPALIRKFHLAKLAMKGDWESIQKDEKTFGPIPGDIRKALGVVDSPENDFNPSDTDASSGPSVLLWGSGKPLREFLYVDDLADACVFLMEKSIHDRHIFFLRDAPGKDTAMPVPNPVFNIGCGEDLTIHNLARLIKKIVGYHGNIIWDGTKPDGTPRKLMDISRISNLGWKPRTLLSAGIEKTYRAYLSHHSISL
jgi:GDP-L-fucose synthase